MPILDLSASFEGIILLSGFGAQQPEMGFGTTDSDTAIYLDGNLIGQDCAGMKSEHPAIELGQILAQRAGLVWQERQTHIWWRFIHRYEDAPATLAEYAAVTLETYQNMTVEKYAAFFDKRSGLPENAKVERAIVKLCYEMSGGDIEQFEAWYHAHLQDTELLNAVHQGLKELEALENSNESGEDKAQRVMALFKSYLLRVFQAEKPLDPAARMARSAL